MRGAVPALLAVVALAGPWFTGSPEIPAGAVAAAQLLAPGTRVAEATLANGGFVRARELETGPEGVRVRSASGWRTLTGQQLAGAVRSRRLWLGSDQLGRSLLARTVHGARVSLVVAVIATSLALLLGTAVGLVGALWPRKLAVPLQVTIDGLLGLPRLLLLLILGLVFENAPLAIALTIGLASWMEVGRLVEAEALALQSRSFVRASVAGGAGRMRVAARHILPNLTTTLAVVAPLVATEAIVLESTLAFLGVGGSSPSSWGRIVADGQALLPGGWWIVVFPGALLTVTALAVHALAGVSRRAAASGLPSAGT